MYFEKNQERYATCGIDDVLSSRIQEVIWTIIDESDIDSCIQLFSLQKFGRFSLLIHKIDDSDVKYILDENFNLSNFDSEIYVYDNGTDSTMFLKNEYSQIVDND